MGFCSLLALLLCSTFTTTYCKEEKSVYRNSHEVGNNRKTAENVNVEAKDKKKKDKKDKKKKDKKNGKKNKKKNKYTPSPPTSSPTKKPTSNNVRVLVTFNDRFGMQTTKNNANIKVTMEDDAWDFMAAEMNPEQVKSYKDDPSVRFVDVDHDMK